MALIANIDMVDKVKQLDLADREFDRLIDVCRKQGLNCWDLEDILLRKACILHTMASAEYCLKGGK